MYLIYIAITVLFLLIISISYYIYKKEENNKAILCIGYIMFFSMIILFLTTIANSILLKVLPYENVLYKQTWSIKSLSISKNVDIGMETFLLGCSIDVNNELYYYFYIDSLNGMIISKIKASDTFIRETEESPKFIKTFTIRKYKYPNFIIGHNESFSHYRENYTNFLEVPKDTIRLKFEVNQHEIK